MWVVRGGLEAPMWVVGTSSLPTEKGEEKLSCGGEGKLSRVCLGYGGVKGRSSTPAEYGAGLAYTSRN